DRAAGIHLPNSFRFLGQDCRVPLGYAFEKSSLCLLDTISELWRGGSSFCPPVLAQSQWHEQYNCHIGSCISDGQFNHTTDHFQVQPAAVALVSNGRIVIAIG